MKKIILMLLVISISTSIFAQWNVIAELDTATFESIYPYIEIDSSAQNIWQIGEPQKVFFDSAYASQNAIVTDTINDYPVNNYSYFDLKIGYFNYGTFYPYDIFIEIKHKYDTDSLMDGGYITISYDSGQTWINIIDDNSFMYWCQTPTWQNGNLYSTTDSLANGKVGFSGNSGDWVSTWFAWHDCPVKSNSWFPSDTMIVRFNFFSDSINTNKEGWMIDDIRLYAVDLGGSTRELGNSTFKLYPNPIQKTATIEFEAYYNNIDLEVYNIQGQLLMQQSYSNSQSINFDSRELLQGIYFLNITADDKVLGQKKFIVNRP